VNGVSCAVENLGGGNRGVWGWEKKSYHDTHRNKKFGLGKLAGFFAKNPQYKVDGSGDGASPRREICSRGQVTQRRARKLSGGIRVENFAKLGWGLIREEGDRNRSEGGLIYGAYQVEIARAPIRSAGWGCRPRKLK